MRGDTVTASAMLAAVRDWGEEPQQQAAISLIGAYIAVARGQPENALRHAREVLTHADALGLAYVAYAWPLAARTAFELTDTLSPMSWSPARLLSARPDPADLARRAGSSPRSPRRS